MRALQTLNKLAYFIDLNVYNSKNARSVTPRKMFELLVDVTELDDYDDEISTRFYRSMKERHFQKLIPKLVVQHDVDMIYDELRFDRYLWCNAATISVYRLSVLCGLLRGQPSVWYCVGGGAQVWNRNDPAQERCDSTT